MNVYLKAAKVLAPLPNSPLMGCCFALLKAGDKGWRNTDKFEQLFRNDDSAFWGMNWEDSLSTAQECRVLALCFAAAMRETGDI